MKLHDFNPSLSSILTSPAIFPQSPPITSHTLKLRASWLFLYTFIHTYIWVYLFYACVRTNMHNKACLIHDCCFYVCCLRVNHFVLGYNENTLPLEGWISTQQSVVIHSSIWPFRRMVFLYLFGWFLTWY